MAIVFVAHHPELTAESAMEVFRRHFGDRYDVYKPWLFGRLFANFVVKKSAWIGVGVQLKQWGEETAFGLGGMVPSPILDLLFMGPIADTFLGRRWKAMEEEVSSFIENAEEFK